MNIQVDSTSSNLASAILNSKVTPRAVVGYGVKIFHPSPPNYVTRSPGYLWDLMLQLCASFPFFHLRNIFNIRKFLSVDSAKTLAITSKVDYCDSLLYGQPKCVLRDLQRVLNCSERLIYSASKFKHVTPLFLNLRGLFVQQRIILKIALITFKALHASARSYITELIRP